MFITISGLGLLLKELIFQSLFRFAPNKNPAALSRGIFLYIIYQPFSMAKFSLLHLYRFLNTLKFLS